MNLKTELTMDNNLDALKQQWQQLSNSTVAGVDPALVTSRVMTGRQGYMLRFYRVLIIVCLVWILLGPMALLNAGMPMALCVSTCVYFAVMAVLCFVTYQRIREIDFGSMTVVELLASVGRVMHTRLVSRCIGLALCVPLMASMLYCFSQNRAMLVGGIAGAVLGGTIGYISDAKIRRYLKEIRRELMSVDS